MKCFFTYCLYNSHYSCMFDEYEIEMGPMGMCDACVMVSIPPDDLQMYKDRQLK